MSIVTNAFKIIYILLFFLKGIILQSQENKASLFNKLALMSLAQKDSTLNTKFKSVLSKHKDQNYTEALEDAFILLEISKKIEDPFTQFRVSSLIGDIYKRSNNYHKSIEYYNSALKILTLQKSISYETGFTQQVLTVETANMYLKIGGIYHRLLIQTEKPSSKTTNNSNFFHYRDSAILHYEKLDDIKSVNDKVLTYKADSYHNLSGIFQQDSLFEKAKELILKSIDIYKNKKDKIKLAGSYNNLGNIFLAQKDFSSAKVEYFKGTELIKDNKSPEAISTIAKLYYNLAWAMRQLKDYKAYDYQELSYEIEDKERDKEIRGIVEEITAKHKENLEKQKVDLVKNQIELEKHQKRTTNYLLGALSLLILTISGVVIYNYTLRQRNLHLKIEQNKLVEQQKIAQIKSDSQKMILNAAIDGKETERKQIAETLHDSVSALLSSANMHLLATKRQFNGNTPIELDKTQKIILEASQKVRDLSHNLVSSILLKFGLEYSLQDITQKYSNSELTFHPNMSNIPRYDQDFEIKMYNVIHELINNIIKHSKAANAYIVLEDTGDFLSVLIEDDGVGFNYRNSKVKSGLGLNQIEARIQMMNGNIIIESAENRGTKITMSVPTIKKKEVNLV
ncbi:conserved hypothetical protein [Tenacibaculum sp. 190524A02b]|uniref:histidine kinase n=1 Tax=Tenacibaculum vairaonense TaxID=3137860 RepID=A0ABM9PJY5_9FLAO